MNSAWSILALPLLTAALLASRVLRGHFAVAGLSLLGSVLGLVQSLRLLSALHAGQLAEWQSEPIQWLELPGGLSFQIGVLLDPASVLLLVIVAVVGTLVQLFSAGYMRGDPGIARYYACLSFFTFSMLGIVLAPNFIQMFVFWELVGLASYLLIGFWFERKSAGDAAKKALITNRVGDFGFMYGILVVWLLAGTVDFAELSQVWPALDIAPELLLLAGVAIFCGAVGKSAQLPLHVWLPDAMEGPTPVSALIHAATMVAAGVYMLFRVSWLWDASPEAGLVVAWVGAATSLFAALIAVTQRDVKRILAYSTLSQLGYMVLAVGIGAKVAGLFHLTTHACFKALLFLSAGSIIHALHHEQDVWKMGGLWRKLPLTCAAFAVGSLALAGVWPFSGFYSKDAILLALTEEHPGLFAVALGTALLTSFYIARAWLLVFWGKSRNAKATGHAHEPAWVMTVPLVVLGVLSLVSGWGSWVPELLDAGYHAAHPEGALAVLFFGLPTFGFAAAWFLYGKAAPADAEADPLRKALGKAFSVLERRFLVDELYERTVLRLQAGLTTVFSDMERYLLTSGLPLTVGNWVLGLGRGVRRLHSGHVGAYLFTFGAGAALLFFLLAAR